MPASSRRGGAADSIRVGAAQFRPAWLDPAATSARMVAWIERAAREQVELLVFPEAALSGYPFWICRTNGSAFEDPRQRRAYGQFLDAAVEVGGAEVAAVAEAARDLRVSVCLGVNERGSRAARGSVFCTAVTIDREKGVVGAHRKLMPTHDERLCWAAGDARDLRTHRLGPALVGTLNCWENWMPLARTALYADGEDVHLGLWPGNPAVCRDAARFVALEGRVWSVVSSGVLSLGDVPLDFEFHGDLSAAGLGAIFAGGSRIIDPAGVTVASAVDGEEALVVHDLDMAAVREARHSFDPMGHYGRPDVFDFGVGRRRREEGAP